MTVWPASLPQKQFLGMTDQDVDSRVFSPNDAGPPSRRNRFRARLTNVSVPIALNGTQRQTFDTFYRTTLANGTGAFDWEDPVTDATVSFAFRSPPRWELVRGGATADRIWQTTLELEIQP